MKRKLRFAVGLSIMTLLATSLYAQTGIGGKPAFVAGPDLGGRDANAYGTQDTTSVTINAFDFEPLFDTDTTSFSPLNGRFQTGTSSGFWIAPVTLPTGVLITGMEIQGCDKSASDMTVLLLSNSVDSAADVETGAVLLNFETDGDTNCAWWGMTAPTPSTVDSYNNTYLLQVVQPALDGTLTFQGVRIFFRRQISPAPGFASFADVPTTHPLHQFVEALAASGITAGCDANNFCPNAPLTRGQMAVFLAKALGLHWPL